MHFEKKKEKNKQNSCIDLGSSLGANLKQLQITRSSVQTAVRVYKLFGCIVTLPRSGRRPKLSPSDERKLVRMLSNNLKKPLLQIQQREQMPCGEKFCIHARGVYDVAFLY
uniref:Transposase Tc1-like domain-containing protein n=1 Tax=Maylandia zebra TaxID=106582 RepID=A0A3P9AWC1_9CICH